MPIASGQSFTPNTPEYNALLAINRYGVVSVRHVLRRYYSSTSERMIQKALATLTTHDFVLQRKTSPKTNRGSGPHIYYLADEGRKYLNRQGVPVLFKKSPSELRHLEARDFAHPEAITDFLISADLAAAQYPENIHITDMRHELVLRAHYRNQKPILDSYIVFQVSEDGEQWFTYPIGLEIDNGTEYAMSFLHKIAALIDWYETRYPHEFGTNRLSIAFIALTGKKRRDDMLLWTKHVLDQLQKTHLFHLFRFTSLHPATTDPYDMFFENVWYIPFYNEPVSLFTELKGNP